MQRMIIAKQHLKVVFPGDRVDLVLTQTVEGEGDPLNAAETVLRNLRVLATDQSTETATDEEGRTVVTAFRTVTLEVTPTIAEKVAVAQTIGTLSLALRSLADNQIELERAIASGSVTIPADATPEEEERLLRAAMGRPIDARGTVSTGGDVSRFQRKSKPAPRGTRSTAPAPGVPSAVGGRPAYAGPTVRVTRGQNTTEVPVGGQQAAANRLLRDQSGNVRDAGRTATSASARIVR